ncbi:MAG: methyltransferase domain-containing protein [Nanoarchaeota archaeon]
MINKFNKFLDNLVGKSSSEKEMNEGDRRMNEIGIDKYNSEIAELWKKVVSYERNERELKLFLKYSRINKNSEILSLGSGLGVFEAFLTKEVCRTGKIACLDISKEMSKEVLKIKKQLDLKNMKVIVSSATCIKLRKNSFDIVLGRRTGLSMKREWLLVLKEVYKLIKKNESSRFIYTVNSKLLGSREKVEAQLDKFGFKLIKIDYFYEKDGTRIAMVVGGVKW